jgi:APA family basic amino acid/polyamine antiporter
MTSQTSLQIPKHDELPRVLSATNALAIVVGIIIGSGIFLVPREMMAATGHSSTVYAVWITGGILSLFGAMCYAELSSMRPRVGGDYVYLHDAYGPPTAFVYTWTITIISAPASVATIAAGLMRILATFPMFAFLERTAFGSILWSQLAAIAAVWLVTAITIASTRDSANLQTVLTGLKIVMILVIAGLCFSGLHGGTWHNFTSIFAGARGGFAGFMVALTAALWAYDGWADVAYIAGEVRNPQRNLPRALIGGVAIVGVLYMLTNAAIQYVLPAASIAASNRPAVDALRVVAGPIGATIVSLGMALSICASFVGSTLTNARISFAAAQDGLFPSPLAAVHPRFKTPWAALTLQATICTLLLIVIGRFQALFSLTIFSEWLFYALSASTVFIFRHREPEADRPYRVTGYPVVPALFILAALVLLVFSIIDQPRNSIGGMILILCGIPLHYLFQRRKQQQAK